MEKQLQLEFLETMCKGTKELFGTIFTEGLALSNEIRRKIDDCYEVGVTRDEVIKVLDKYK